MSVKSQFLKKLQARQPVPVSFTSKTQADIAAFRQRMAQLQEQMDAWLTGTGLNVEPFAASVTDLLVEGGAFDIPGIVLHYDDRSVTFTPVLILRGIMSFMASRPFGVSGVSDGRRLCGFACCIFRGGCNTRSYGRSARIRPKNVLSSKLCPERDNAPTGV
jgi:hypothetical protein